MGFVLVAASWQQIEKLKRVKDLVAYAIQKCIHMHYVTIVVNSVFRY